MKKVTSTLTTLLLCLYVSAQVGALETSSFNNPYGYVINNQWIAGDDYATAVATHSDGRIVVAAFNTDKWFTLVRYMSDGTLDPNFGSGGVVKVRYDNDDNAVPYALYIYPNNTMLVAGTTWNQAGGTGFDFALTRLLEDGSVDGSFGTGGWTVTPTVTGTETDEARSLAVQSDGKIVLAGFGMNGGDSNFVVARYSSNGILDAGVSGFGTGGSGIVITPVNGGDIAQTVSIQSADQKIVVGGTSNSGTTNSDYSIVRYNTDGSLDVSGFGTSGIATIDIAFNGAGSKDIGGKLILQSDGKILMTGNSSAGSNDDVATIRLTTNGVLDTEFGGDGIVTYNYSSTTNSDEDARAITLQSDGKIIVGGDAEDGAGSNYFLLLLRYNSNGTIDSTFNGDGVATAPSIEPTDDEFGHAIILYSNRIYVAGATGNPKDILLAAFQNDGTPLPLVLSQFYAQKQTSKVVLQWQTTSEENLKQFVIERSSDGTTYKAIGTVAATGNSTTAKNYTFTDQSPFTSANNYYRLLMQDIDGNYKYSKILIVKFDGQSTSNMQVFPNPVKDVLQIQLPGGLNGNVTLQVIDMNGRIVKKGNQASDGSSVATTMDVSTLVSGVYVLQAQAGNTSVITRFTKQ